MNLFNQKTAGRVRQYLQQKTRASQDIEYSEGKFAGARSGRGRRRKIWVAILRTTAVCIAVFLSVFLLVTVPVLVPKMSVLIFGTMTISQPDWISTVLLLFYSFFILTICFPFLLAMGWAPLARYNLRPGGGVPFVSIIIPAFNEEESIMRSLKALRNLNYPRFEVIVVNDGSTDFTFSLVEQAQVRCIHLKQNQGKAAALNAGIAEAKGTIIAFSDSDSWLHPMALRYLVEGFSSHEVGAVSGTVEIDPANNLLRRWQLIEYIFGQFFVKIAQLGSGSSVAICPGPVCAFRKDLLIKAGGFTNRTITEDFDATLEIIKAGYKVNYAPKALAYTNAPATWTSLRNQRLRWFRGHLQNFHIHRNLFFRVRYGMLGSYWLPIYYLLLGYACSTLELLFLPVLVLLYFASRSSETMLQAGCLYFLIAHFFVTAGYAAVLHYSDRFSWKLFVAACFISPYLFFLNWLRICAIANQARGKIATWSG